MDIGLVAAVMGLGVIHGVLPDHGWPIAATYALEYPNKWLRGTAAALILGVGHLISSVALVLAYFWFASFAAFAEGPWMKPLAGSLLVALGIYEYVSGGHGHHVHGHEDEHGHHDDHAHGHDHHDDHHAHGHDHSDDHHDDHHAHGHDHSDDHHDDAHSHDHHDEHHDHDHSDDHHDAHDHTERESTGFFGGIRGRLPGGGHMHPTQEHAEQGLLTLGVIALVLGFAHEEPIQILAICAGTEFCLELMLLYSLAVIGAILAPTLLLIAGYQHHRAKIEQYTPYLPTVTAVVLVTVGLAFIVGIF